MRAKERIMIELTGAENEDIDAFISWLQKRGHI